MATLLTHPLSAVTAQAAPVSVPRITRAPVDPWQRGTLAVAVVLSIGSLGYFFAQHQTLIYADAFTHLLIARSVIDNSSPGLAQLGSIWLPIPHLLMLPLIWNRELWANGLAGSIPSMVGYVVSANFVFLSARRLTRSNAASFIAALIFMLNPNVLYMQTTPLTETIMGALLLIACYNFLGWAQDGHPVQLVMAAAATFFATLTRYDGWSLFVMFIVLIVAVGLLKHQPRSEIEGNLILFSALGGFGIFLWLAWNAVIFGDPLYFQHSPYSAQAQQLAYIKAGIIHTNHNVWESVRYFTIDVAQNVGLLLFSIGVVGLVLFVRKRRLSPETLAVLALFVPFPYYVLTLYTGQAIIFTPGASPANDVQHQLFNVRYGVLLVAPFAIIIATVLTQWSFGKVTMLGCLVIQVVATATGGIITLQDGQRGASCIPTHQTMVYLGQHYTGGIVMEDMFLKPQDYTTAHVDFKNVLSQRAPNWQAALLNPAKYAEWLFIAPNDLITKKVNIYGSTFQLQYTLVASDHAGLQLYHRNSDPLHVVRQVSAAVIQERALCDASPMSQYSSHHVVKASGA